MDKLLLNEENTVREALKQMDLAGEKILFIVDAKRKLCGSLTDGDIRRWLLKEGSLHEKIKGIFNPQPRVVTENENIDRVREIMLTHKIEALPVVDPEGVLVDVFLWDSTFGGEQPQKKGDLKVPVVVMAGGKGSRLEPFTKILPKPLIPVGDKPIIELIMDQFLEYGCNPFFLTVNYKGKMIQSYFDHADSKYNVRFVWEEEFLGTAGSLKLAAPQIDAAHLFVSNCDILIRADYADIYHFHTQNDNDVTIIGSMQHLSVPFGVLQMKNGGHLEKIVEKPEFDFLANTGMYLIKTSVINLIAPHEKIDFPDLLHQVQKSGKKIGIYPISQQSWVDIGQWQEYQNALKKLEHIN